MNEWRNGDLRNLAVWDSAELDREIECPVVENNGESVLPNRCRVLISYWVIKIAHWVGQEMKWIINQR